MAPQILTEYMSFHMRKILRDITLFGKKLFARKSDMNNRFDEKKISHIYSTAPFIVKYYVYGDKEKRTGDFNEESIKKYNLPFKKNTNTSCFAQLAQLLATFSTENNEWPNRVLFLCDFKKHNISKCHTTLEERYWWISVCKYYKLLPEYIEESFAKTGNIVFEIDTLNLKTLYIYLIIARHLQEEPYFVKGIKYLVEEKGVDFYIAFAVASRCCIENKAHHVISLGKQYPFAQEHNSINSVKYYNINHMFRLIKFMEGEVKDKETIIKDQKIGTMIGSFRLHDTLSKIKSNCADIKSENLVFSKVVDVFDKPVGEETPVGNAFCDNSFFAKVK